MWTNTSGNSVPDPYTINPAISTSDNRDVLSRTKKSPADVGGANAITVVVIGDSLSSNGLTQEVAPSLYTIANPTKLFNLNLWDGEIVVASEPLIGNGPKLLPGYTGVAHWLTKCCDELITANTNRKFTMVPVGYGGTISADWSFGGARYERIVATGRRLDSMGLLSTTNVIVHVCLGTNDVGLDEVLGSNLTASYAANLGSIILAIKTYMPGAKILLGKASWIGTTGLNPVGHLGQHSSVVRSAVDAAVDNVTTFAGADWDTLNDTFRGPDFVHWNFATGLPAVSGLVKAKVALFV